MNKSEFIKSHTATERRILFNEQLMVCLLNTIILKKFVTTPAMHKVIMKQILEIAPHTDKSVDNKMDVLNS